MEIDVGQHDRAPCETWSDHVWGGRQFVDTGRHPTMGHYQRYLVRCDHCGKETTETEWLDVLPPPRRSETCHT